MIEPATYQRGDLFRSPRQNRLRRVLPVVPANRCPISKQFFRSDHLLLHGWLVAHQHFSLRPRANRLASRTASSRFVHTRITCSVSPSQTNIRPKSSSTASKLQRPPCLSK